MGCYVCCCISSTVPSRTPSYPRGYESSHVYVGSEFSVKLFIGQNSFLEVEYADLSDIMHLMTLPDNNSHYLFVIL